LSSQDITCLLQALNAHYDVHMSQLAHVHIDLTFKWWGWYFKF